MAKKRGRIFLREWREYRNRTQSELAGALGVTKTHVSNIERGERQYTQELLEAAADYLKTAPALILTVDPKDPKGKWSLWETAERVPEAKLDDAKRIMEALAEPPVAPFEADAPAPAKRRRRRAT